MASRTGPIRTKFRLTDWLPEEKIFLSLDPSKKRGFWYLHPKGSDTTKEFTQNILQLISNPIKYKSFHFINEDTETE